MAGVLLLSEEEEVSRVEAMVGPKSEENGRRKYIPLLSLAPRALALYLNLRMRKYLELKPWSVRRAKRMEVESIYLYSL